MTTKVMATSWPQATDVTTMTAKPTTKVENIGDCAFGFASLLGASDIYKATYTDSDGEKTVAHGRSRDEALQNLREEVMGE